jgi:SNF2 family DNA or RNA helicase
VMPHSPLDVYGQWRFLDPEAFGTKLADGTTRPWSFHEFRNRFAVMGGYLGKEVTGFKNLDALQDTMAERAIVVRKEDALDLPPTTESIMRINLSPAEKKAYADMRKALALSLADGTLMTAPNPLVQMLRLRQITSGYVTDDVTGQHVQIGDAKARAIASLVNDTLAGEARVVIFAHFRADVAAIAKRVEDSVIITGDTSAHERQAIRKRFAAVDDPDHERMVLVCQMRTMSLAVNELVTASHAVFASLSERRDDLIQARDRLNRIGQTRPVTYWMAIAPGTVDQVMLDAHQNRTNLESAMLRHIKGEDV